MTKTSRLLFAAVMFLILASACTKKGDPGATGATGTANVMYSSWASLTMSYNTTDSAYEQTITADSITQSVLDSGLVLTYIKYTNPAGQTQVESADTYMQTVLAIKSIQLYSYVYDLTGVPFRYIVVHGGTALGGRVAEGSDLVQGFTKEQWKAMSYTEVLQRLGIQ